MICALALTASCGKSMQSPSSPSTANPADSTAAADGSTLKVTAPAPVSPVTNQRLEPGVAIVLVTSNATATFGGAVALSYRFEVFNAAGVSVHRSELVPQGPGASTTYTVPAAVELVADQPHQWQVRAEFQGAFGPSSARASFMTASTEGFIRGNEMYDPLINGKTVGTIHGPVTFIPGLGVKLETLGSYISYELPQTLTEGEFSLLVTDMPANTEGGKTKLFAMSEGYADLVTNDRRMSVEKRGDPPGVIAWRFITHDDQIDTVGAERVSFPFQSNLTYFWVATWRNNRFNVLIREGGFTGRQVYNFGKNFVGIAYDPSPHVLFIGAPEGRSGLDGASVEGVIIRQVWVSSRPRPDSANK